MGTNYSDSERYYQAQNKVEEIKKFYQHLTVYLLCNPIIIVVNLMTSPGYLYFWYSLLGWGIGVALHGLKAFDCFPFFNREWEQQKIREIMDREIESHKQTWK